MIVDCNSSKAESTQSVGVAKATAQTDEVDSTVFQINNSSRRKSVSFVDDIHTVVTMLVPFYEMTKEERRAIWWSKKDFVIFRQHAQMLASHERQISCQFDDPSTPQLCEYQRAKRFVETNCMTEDLLETTLLNFRLEMITHELRCLSVPELRGLEQWTSRSYSEMKRILTEEHRKTVLKSNRNAVADKAADKSRVCRLVARFWGEADSHVLQESSLDVIVVDSFRSRTKSPTSLSESRSIKVPIQHRGIA